MTSQPGCPKPPSRALGHVLQQSQRIPYRAITQGINVIIYIERTPTGRRVKTVSRLVGRQDDAYQLEAVAH